MQGRSGGVEQRERCSIILTVARAGYQIHLSAVPRESAPPQESPYVAPQSLRIALPARLPEGQMRPESRYVPGRIVREVRALGECPDERLLEGQERRYAGLVGAVLVGTLVVLGSVGVVRALRAQPDGRRARAMEEGAAVW